MYSYCLIFLFDIVLGITLILWIATKERGRQNVLISKHNLDFGFVTKTKIH